MPSPTCGTALLQQRSRVAKAQVHTYEAMGGGDVFEAVDGGEDRACRGADANDESESYFSLSTGVASLEDCMARCEDEPNAPPPKAGACPKTAEGLSFGRVQTSQIDECSGLAASRRNRGLYWVNNDSGDRQRLYAIDLHGTFKARMWVDGAHAHDWEDVAMGPGPSPGSSYIYVADTGDNHRGRSTVQLYRILEPEVQPGQDPNADIHAGSQSFSIRYPDGAHDCEAMFIDQGPAAERRGTSGRVYLITKGDGQNRDARWRGGDVYWVDLPSEPASLTFTHAGHVPIAWVTGADMSPSGSFIVIRTYGELLMWPRADGSSVEQSLTGTSCTVNRKDEKQGEAVAFGAKGDHYITVSEGMHPKVWYFELTGAFQRSMMAMASPVQCRGIDYAADGGRCKVWHRAEGIQASAPLAGHTCLRYGPPTCGGVEMRDVDLVCPAPDGSACKVLANNMRQKTCREYCGRMDLACVGGWEEENENCRPTVELGCDRSYGTTSDLLCECAPPQAATA